MELPSLGVLGAAIAMVSAGLPPRISEKEPPHERCHLTANFDGSLVVIAGGSKVLVCHADGSSPVPIPIMRYAWPRGWCVRSWRCGICIQAHCSDWEGVRVETR